MENLPNDTISLPSRIFYSEEEDKFYFGEPGDYKEVGEGTSTSSWTIPCTLLGDGIEQGDNVLSFTAPFDFKITKITAYVYDVPTGQDIQLGVAIDETAIGVTEPFIVIPANSKLSTNTPDIVGASISEGDLISINVVQVGSINTGDCLTIYIEYEKL